jgi:hypothetical protein
MDKSKYTQETEETFRELIKKLSSNNISENKKFDLLWDFGEYFNKGI